MGWWAHHAFRGVTLLFRASRHVLRAYLAFARPPSVLCLSTRTLGVFARVARPRAGGRLFTLMSFALLFEDPSSSRPSLETLWGARVIRHPLVGFRPLRRLRSERPLHIRLPPRIQAPLMPILTASATCSGFRSFRYFSGNVLGVLCDLQGFPLVWIGRSSPMTIPSWRF